MSKDARFARVIDAAPETVFDTFTGEDGQEAFYREQGWFVESACDLRVGGVWTVTFGPSRDEVYRHHHVFQVIERPRRVSVDTTESRPDGSTVGYETEFIFEERDGKTLMTMIHRGLPTAELRDEHQAGVAGAFSRLEQAMESRRWAKPANRPPSKERNRWEGSP